MGEENLKAAAAQLVKAIYSNNKILIVVDADADGFTSSAILINYLYDLFPSWVENNLYYFSHSLTTIYILFYIIYMNKKEAISSFHLMLYLFL